MLCVPEMPKVNLPPDICHMKPQLRPKFVIFEAGKIAENSLSAAATTWAAMGQNSGPLYGYFSPQHLAY